MKNYFFITAITVLFNVCSFSYGSYLQNGHFSQQLKERKGFYYEKWYGRSLKRKQFAEQLFKEHRTLVPGYFNTVPDDRKEAEIAELKKTIELHVMEGRKRALQQLFCLGMMSSDTRNTFFYIDKTIRKYIMLKPSAERNFIKNEDENTYGFRSQYEPFGDCFDLICDYCSAIVPGVNIDEKMSKISIPVLSQKLEKKDLLEKLRSGSREELDAFPSRKENK